MEECEKELTRCRALTKIPDSHPYCNSPINLTSLYICDDKSYKLDDDLCNIRDYCHDMNRRIETIAKCFDRNADTSQYNFEDIVNETMDIRKSIKDLDKKISSIDKRVQPEIDLINKIKNLEEKLMAEKEEKIKMEYEVKITDYKFSRLKDELEKLNSKDYVGTIDTLHILIHQAKENMLNIECEKSLIENKLMNLEKENKELKNEIEILRTKQIKEAS